MVRLSEHIGTIGWAFAGRLLFVGYGFVMLLQIAVVPPEEYGLYALLVNVQTWIFILSDSSALLGLVQFGADVRERARLNTLVGMLHSGIVLGIAGLLWLVRVPLAHLFQEPRVTVALGELPLYCLLSIPRTYCVKLLYRELQMRKVFALDLSWLGVMAVLTLWMVWRRELRGFPELLLIACTGMGVSSLYGVWLCRPWLQFGLCGSITLRQILRFTLPQTLASALHTGVRQLDVYAVQYFFGLAIVGVYQAAKTFYRVFDTVFDAVAGLLHPAAVRLLATGERERLRILLGKMLSALSFTIAGIVLLIELGGAELLLPPLLAREYEPAVDYFKLLSLGALGVPFAVLGPAILALGHSRRVLLHITVATGMGAGALLLAGLVGNPLLSALGVAVYTLVLGALNFRFVRRAYGLGWRELLRFPRDLRGVVHFIRSGRA